MTGSQMRSYIRLMIVAGAADQALEVQSVGQMSEVMILQALQLRIAYNVLALGALVAILIQLTHV